MQIHRVVRDLVTTKRNFWLAAKSLRVVEDHRGNLEVALDPIGAKPGDYVVTIGVSGGANRGRQPEDHDRPHHRRDHRSLG